MFLWNPINLVDGEARWIGKTLLYIGCTFILSKGLGILIRRLSSKIKNASFSLLSDSIFTPFIFFIWYLTALLCFDLVTDNLLSEGHPRTWSIFLNGGVVLSIGWFLIRFKNRYIAHAMEEKVLAGKIPDANSMLAVSKIFTIIICVLIAILLNDVTGLSLTTLLAFGGVGGLAIAFASQEIVSNFFGGFMIHMTRPFLLGETISIPAHSVEGIVEEIGWYQTRIRSTAKSAVYIPNSLFTKALLINKSRITHRLLDDSILIQLTPLSSISVVIQDIDAYLSKHPRFDHNEWAGARIRSLQGPSCELGLYGLTKCSSLEDFYHVRDGVLLHTTEIILSRGGQLVSPNIVISPLSRS
jgi:MscS family membrane protein